MCEPVAITFEVVGLRFLTKQSCYFHGRMSYRAKLPCLKIEIICPNFDVHCTSKQQHTGLHIKWLIWRTLFFSNSSYGFDIDFTFKTELNLHCLLFTSFISWHTSVSENTLAIEYHTHCILLFAGRGVIVMGVKLKALFSTWARLFCWSYLI